MKFFLMILTLITFTFCSSCNDKQKKEELQRKIEEQDRQLKQQEADAQTLKDNQTALNEKLQEQQKQIDLEKLAKNQPITISSITIFNQTNHGNVLSTGKTFKKDEIRFMGWSTYYTDNVVKAGGKTFGTLYVRYMRKNDGYENSWTVLRNSGSFYQTDGTVTGYTTKYDMVDDGKENDFWSEAFGSEVGYDFSIGKWRIELFWDQDKLGKSIFLGGEYFEVY